MVIDVGGVLSAYKKSGGIMDDAGAGATSAAADGKTFASSLKSFMGDAITTLRDGEKAAIDHAQGKTDLVSVTTAIQNAEVTLNEVVAIRDKVISAYQAITSAAI